MAAKFVKMFDIEVGIKLHPFDSDQFVALEIIAFVNLSESSRAQ
jgi:hypothetical protein